MLSELRTLLLCVKTLKYSAHATLMIHRYIILCIYVLYCSIIHYTGTSLTVCAYIDILKIACLLLYISLPCIFNNVCVSSKESNIDFKIIYHSH